MRLLSCYNYFGDNVMRNKRIRELENYYDECFETINKLSNAISLYEKSYKKLVSLYKYYGSEDYFKDVDDSNKGLFVDLKCGILSEDAIYDLLVNNHDLAIRMLKLGTKIEEDF